MSWAVGGLRAGAQIPEMTLPFVPALLLQLKLWELLPTQPIPIVVMALLVLLSVLSWAVIFSKYSTLRQANTANRQFLRAFRKANGLEQVALAGDPRPPRGRA